MELHITRWTSPEEMTLVHRYLKRCRIDENLLVKLWNLYQLFNLSAGGGARWFRVLHLWTSRGNRWSCLFLSGCSPSNWLTFQRHQKWDPSALPGSNNLIPSLERCINIAVMSTRYFWWHRVVIGQRCYSIASTSSALCWQEYQALIAAILMQYCTGIRINTI